MMWFAPFSAHAAWSQLVDTVANDEVLRFSLLAAGVVTVLVLIAAMCEGDK